VPIFRGFDLGAEDGAGRFVFIHRALGMPLHRQHEVIGGRSFQRFDDPVVGQRAEMRRPSPIAPADWWCEELTGTTSLFP